MKGGLIGIRRRYVGWGDDEEDVSKKGIEGGTGGDRTRDE